MAAALLLGTLGCQGSIRSSNRGDGSVAPATDARVIDSTSIADSAISADGSSDGRVADASSPTDSTVALIDSGPVPMAACSAATGGGAAHPQMPVLTRTLIDRWHEAWLASPAVVDLDGDGENEIVVPRDGRIIAWRPSGAIKWSVDASGSRIWAPPVIANFTGTSALEVAVASRDKIYMYSALGQAIGGFPVTWRDEVRSLAAADLDGNGQLELVGVTSGPLSSGGQRDIVMAWRANGSVMAGFPPNTTGVSGCTSACTVTGGFDQTLAIGRIDSDATDDILIGQDNSYLSWHRGSGVAFESASIFRNTVKAPGVRFLHDYAEAKQGYSDHESTALQAHFTNSAPAIADFDGDGTRDLIIVGSVQNVAQTQREKGVALWAIRPDGSRLAGWETPFHVPTFLGGLWDPGNNIVGTTNEVVIVDLDPMTPGKDAIFAGFDGQIHAVSAAKTERFATRFTSSADILTSGVVVADLSGDGRPEIVFATYSTRQNVSALYVLAANGAIEHQIALPGRGAMPVPTIADVDRNGTLEIVVSLKDGEDRVRSALVYSTPGSSTNCLLWPTGRGGYRRTGAPDAP